MYESHFGFHRQPFQSAGTDKSFFESACVREVVPQILHTLRSDLGMAVLTGPCGSGRTTTLRHIQSLLAREGRPVLCSGACLNAPGHLDTLLSNASQQLAGTPGSSPARFPSQAPSPGRSLTDQLRKSSEFWGPVFLLIDDAHLVPAATLNEIRAITEDIWNGRSMVRCLVSGPLSFEEDLARPDHMDFSRRIRCHVFLKPLNSRESVDFLDFQISAAGGRLVEVFSKSALELIVQASDGLPRCLSLLADESLLQACREQRSRVEEDTVRQALSHLQHLPYSWSVSPRQDDDERHDLPPTESVHSPTAYPEEHVISRLASDSTTHSVIDTPGVVEFGSTGVIEIGGPSSESPQGPGASEVPPSPEVVPPFETPAHEPVSGISELQVDFPEVARRQQDDLRHVLFEIGNRYATSRTLVEVPDVVDAEATDFVDVTECVDLLNDVPAESDGASVESGLTNSQHAVARDFGFEETQSVLPSHRNFDSAGSDPTSGITEEIEADEDQQLEGTAVSANLTGTSLSQRIPVFDRYTWLSLGREVPSGGFSVSSSSRLKQPLNGVLPHDVTSLPWNDDHSPVFTGRIPVSTVADSEILAQWLPAQLAPELHGIVEFPIHSGHQWQTEQPAATSLHVLVADEITEIDHPDAAEPQPHYTTASIPSEEVTETDAQIAIEEFQRPSLFVRNSKSDVSNPTRSDASWRDGQLVFGEMPWTQSVAAGEAVCVSQEIISGTDANTDACSPVSLGEVVSVAIADSYDSNLRVTADASALPARPSFAETSNSLLSSGLLPSDDVMPLARSLAELQDEVTSFRENMPERQRDLRSDEQSVREATTVFQTESATSESWTSDSLVSLARQRLMEDHADTKASQQSDATAQSLATADTPVSLLNGCEGAGFEAPSAAPIRLTQLFTRLRQKKHST